MQLIQQNISVADGATSEPVIINGYQASLTIIPAGTAKIQITADKDLGSGNWVDWIFGDVTENTVGEVESGWYAVRIVSTSGATTGIIGTQQ